MATPVQDYASMPAVVQQQTPIGGQVHSNSAVSPKHHRAVTIGFLVFFAAWYLASPYFPETLKQFLSAVLH